MKSSNWVRNGNLAALVAVPALAVAFLGGSILTGGVNMPAGMQLSETREFNHAGQNLATPNTKKDAAAPVETFLGDWQNTVRTPPSPRV